MPQPFSWQLKYQKWNLDPRGVVSAFVAVTNKLSKVTKQAFTYDNPFEKMADNLFWLSLVTEENHKR